MKLRLFALGLAMLSAAPLSAQRTSAEEANRVLVTRFYDAVVNEKDVAKARTMVGAQYVQHNPGAADGVEGMEKFIAFLKTNAPQAHNEVKRSFVDGDHVILHVLSKRQPTDRGRAIVEIFRVSGGKVVEHWDAIQDIPEKSLNTNTMF
jgi:predicted SnoaL-like aldol condensation-catalyzing enzyme